MLAAGVIEPSDSTWASQACLVRKPDVKYRLDSVCITER